MAILTGGFKYFSFSPLFGEDFQFDGHIFQMGWFNHQPGILLMDIFIPPTRWAPTSYKLGYSPYKWPKINGFSSPCLTLPIGVISPNL